MKMYISHNWLQSFFSESLPSREVITEKLLLHSFEVENVESAGNDTVYELDILPDRSSDCLAHYGIAKEVSTICRIPLTKKYFKDTHSFSGKRSYIKTDMCDRYTLTYISKIQLSETPTDIRQYLEAIGQRSINPIIDFSNYMLFELGQPNHVFDAQKVVGDVTVRNAKEGEEIILLGDESAALTEKDIVIADEEGPIALAGIKGGSRAAVSENTKDILLEIATFDAATIRATSRRLGIQSDASARFTQGFPAEMIEYTAHAIIEVYKKFGTVTESYDDCKVVSAAQKVTGVSISEVNKRLGTQFIEKDIAEILEALGFSYEYIDPRKQFVEKAKEQVGVVYKWGASVSKDAPHAFDCSSLVAWCAAQAGMPFPRVSINQFLSSQQIKTPQTGDLVFFSSSDKELPKRKEQVFEAMFPVSPGIAEEGINHVGIVSGDGICIQAQGSSGPQMGANKVIETPIPEGALYTSIWDGEKRFLIKVPVERTDIILQADIIEEIGRIYGWNSIPSSDMQRKESMQEGTTKDISKPTTIVHDQYAKQLALVEKLRGIGFSEIMTYSFVEKSDVCVAYPVARDKGCLRKNLKGGMEKALEQNAYRGELFNMPYIAMFEIGSVFTKEGESQHLCIGVREILGRKKINEKEILKDIQKVLPECTELKNGIWEYPLEEIHIEAKEYIYPESKREVQYRIPSRYPFVLRDISVFVPNATTQEEVERILRESGGEYIRQVSIYDIFLKDEKISYTFRIVFQSDSETLQDTKVQKYMDSIYKACAEKGYEIR